MKSQDSSSPSPLRSVLRPLVFHRGYPPPFLGCLLRFIPSLLHIITSLLLFPSLGHFALYFAHGCVMLEWSEIGPNEKVHIIIYRGRRYQPKHSYNKKERLVTQLLQILVFCCTWTSAVYKLPLTNKQCIIFLTIHFTFCLHPRWTWREVNPRWPQHSPL